MSISNNESLYDSHFISVVTQMLLMNIQTVDTNTCSNSLNPSRPVVPNGYISKHPGPYWSNPPFS